MTDAHGWSFVELDRLVHSGPLDLVRVIFYSNDDADVLKAYDGLSDTGRQVFQISGEDAKSEAFELGVRLTTGLYVTLTADCNATLIFDPLGDE